MDFTRFLHIKPEIEQAIVDCDTEIAQTKQALTQAQMAYDAATTQGNQLRTVLSFLNEIVVPN